VIEKTQLSRPLPREWTIKVANHRGVYIRVLGLQLFFGADRDKVFLPLLETGRLDVLDFPRPPHCRRGWLVLQQIGQSGLVKKIGSVSYDAKRHFYVDDKPARDEKGEVIGAAPGQPPRCTNADTLFPVLGRVWRVNNSGRTGRNFIAFDKKPFILPTDQNTRYGTAARAEKITALVLPDQERIHFYDRSAEPRRHKTRHINWLPLNTPGRKEGDSAVYLADHLSEFRQKDIPVIINCGKAFVFYRGVKINFSVDADSRYYPDLAAERLFIRAGRPDRIEAVRKAGSKTQVLGKILIKDSCLIVGDRRIPLDRPGDNTSFAIEDAIEGLGGREVKLEPGKVICAFGLRLPFPENVGNFYRPSLQAGRVYGRVFRDKLVVGCKEKERFTEIGRVLEKQIERDGRIQPRVDLVELISELGRFEERVAPGKNFVYRQVNSTLVLEPGDRYYSDLQNGCLVFRAIGRRLEFLADRAGKLEFIGATDRSSTGDLLELFPALKAKTTGGEVSGFNLLKRQVLRLAGTAPQDGVPIVELFNALSGGLKWLEQEAELSSDLKSAFAREIRQALKPWRSHYLRARLGLPVAAAPAKLDIPAPKAEIDIPETEHDLPGSLDELELTNLVGS
jgi:hypothetical protein